MKQIFFLGAALTTSTQLITSSAYGENYTQYELLCPVEATPIVLLTSGGDPYYIETMEPGGKSAALYSEPLGDRRAIAIRPIDQAAIIDLWYWRSCSQTEREEYARTTETHGAD